MNIKQDVIVDLLPLYFEGNASEDSCALIEAYFEEHPKFAASMNRLYQQLKVNQEEQLQQTVSVDIDPDVKLRTMQKTKRLLNIRSGLFITGVLSFILPILFMVLVKESDAAAWAKYVVTGVLTVIMPAAWIGYAFIRYRMRSSGDW